MTFPTDNPEVEIERLSFGGEGVARLSDGRVVFVRGALPGDRVAVRLYEERARFCRAEVARLITPSPQRVPEACPVAGRCGGCQLWGLSPEVAWAHKREAAIDAATRAGRLDLSGVSVEAVAAPADRRYRRRLRLHVDEGGATGFYRAGTRALLPIEDCLVAHPALLTARDALAPLLAGTGAGSLVLELDGAGPGVVASVKVARGDELARRLERALADGALGPVLGARVERGRRHDPLEIGQVRFDWQAGPFALRLPVGGFTQANDAVNALMIERAVALLGAGAGDRVLELYCGAGNFSLPVLAAGASLLGLELGAGAVEAAEANTARLLGDAASARATFEVHDLTGGLSRAARRGRFSHVLLDPPRTGAREVVPDLLKLAAPRMVYVSCDPPTLGRDLGALVRGGYRLEALVAFDMFPRTYHTELVAALSR